MPWTGTFLSFYDSIIKMLLWGLAKNSISSRQNDPVVAYAKRKRSEEKEPASKRSRHIVGETTYRIVCLPSFICHIRFFSYENSVSLCVRSLNNWARILLILLFMVSCYTCFPVVLIG